MAKRKRWIKSGKLLIVMGILPICFELEYISFADIQTQTGAVEIKDYNDDKKIEYGSSVVMGNTYDPTDDIGFLQISGFLLYDYESIWHHKAPEELRFKAEYSFGATTAPYSRVITSVNMFALYYLEDYAVANLQPYLEAGIGMIYTDFQAEGQGTRINFNPQAGLGVEYLTSSGSRFFTSIRAHHISNGDLYKDNRGINSVVLVFGRFF